MKQSILVIAHNIRSAHNIGALFRTCDGFGVEEIFLSGYSPIPAREGALYRNSGQKAIAKTALGAENVIRWSSYKTLRSAIKMVRMQGYTIIALEQGHESVAFSDVSLRSFSRIAIILGNEARGLSIQAMKQCDVIAEIPMLGKKESLNVTSACASFLAILRYGGGNDDAPAS